MSGKSVMDTKMDLVLSLVLRTGLAIAIGMILMGGILYFRGNGTIGIEERVFQGVPYQTGAAELVSSLWRRDGQAWIYLGLILLVATPVVRVAFCALLFLLEKDWIYVAASLLVLAILLYSLIV